jgi:hypothetical protein
MISTEALHALLNLSVLDGFLAAVKAHHKEYGEELGYAVVALDRIRQHVLATAPDLAEIYTGPKKRKPVVTGNARGKHE